MYRAISLILSASAALSAQTPTAAQDLVKRHCQGCHNAKLKSGGVSLEGLATTAVGPDARTWEKVLRKVRTGEMPPPGLPRPNAEAHAAFVTWLERQLDRAALLRPNPGTPSIHRLNRSEYANAIRDVLALETDVASGLPADDSGYGFDNIGEVLTISPLHMEKYMSAARRVSRLAVGTVQLRPAVERFNPGRGIATDGSSELPPNERGGILIRRHFPLDAEYTILVRVRGNPSPNLPPARLDIRMDGQRVKLLDAAIDTAEEAQDTRNFELRLPVKAGVHEIGAGFLSEYARVESPESVGRRFGPPQPATPASVDYVSIGGPFHPSGPGSTESRKRIFVCRPGPGVPEAACAERIVRSVARRAYRRPVTLADIGPLMKFYAAGRAEGGSFDEGIERALRAILVSPNFLFRVERTPAGAAPETVHRISDLELASRLSFFLWSSGPDPELLRLASQGVLRPVLNQQVRRMLADPKSKALVENFAGQWLQLRNIPGWRPDPDKFPQFDDSLRTALQRETELFFRHIVREDRSVLEFLNAGYSFLNERLARHYGIKDVRGSYFRRVSLNGDERGGVLTHGSILTVTSYPTRTSPVLRGKWILENVLGAPPPPPPPDAGVLADNAAISAQDLRKALEKHRENAACASCHSRLDPLGFALENYDAVGKFRSDADSSGVLPGGAPFRGASGLRRVLMERQDEFVECLAEKLLTYALGRGLEYYDLPAVRQIRRAAAVNDYRFSSLALAIADSVPFQMRRTPAR